MALRMTRVLAREPFLTKPKHARLCTRRDLSKVDKKCFVSALELRDYSLGVGHVTSRIFELPYITPKKK